MEVPTGNDDIGFFRAIALSLGVSVNLNSKAQQLRDRIEDTLASGDLLLCLDEATRCWPQSNYRHALPSRVNWVLAMVNRKIPIVLITTPQFFGMHRLVVSRTAWTSPQFTGRIGRFKKLPDTVPDSDLKALAKNFFPALDSRSIDKVVSFVSGAGLGLPGLIQIRDRAAHFAKKLDNASLAQIISAAIADILTSNADLNRALDAPLAAVPTRARRRQIASPMQDPCMTPANGQTTTPRMAPGLDNFERGKALRSVKELLAEP